MARFAIGRIAKGICDVCGFEYRLNRLRYVFVHGRNTRVKACPTCWDEDHPQNFLAERLAALGPEAIALRDPRPEITTIATLGAARFVPGTVAAGFFGPVIMYGSLGGYAPTVVFDNAPYIIANVLEHITPSSLRLTIYVDPSVATGQYLATMSDGNGRTVRAALNVTNNSGFGAGPFGEQPFGE